MDKIQNKESSKLFGFALFNYASSTALHSQEDELKDTWEQQQIIFKVLYRNLLGGTEDNI